MLHEEELLQLSQGMQDQILLSQRERCYIGSLQLQCSRDGTEHTTSNMLLTADEEADMPAMCPHLLLLVDKQMPMKLLDCIMHTRSTRCYAVFRAMLCHTQLCYAMLCHAVLCHAVPCHAVPCYAMLCHAMPCYAMPCCVMPCCAMLCHAMPCHAHGHAMSGPKFSVQTDSDAADSSGVYPKGDRHSFVGLPPGNALSQDGVMYNVLLQLRQLPLHITIIMQSCLLPFLLLLCSRASLGWEASEAVELAGFRGVCTSRCVHISTEVALMCNFI